MWILTENRGLVNLDQQGRVEANNYNQVLAWFPQDQGYLLLCRCDDEDHGKEIIVEICCTMEAIQEGAEYGPVIYVEEIKRAIANRRKSERRREEASS